MSINMQRGLIIAGVVLVLLYPAAYIGMYAGDAEIHLVYAENAANGDFFEFNRGEKSSGVTSPGYMMMLAALFKLAPATLVPAIVKSLNLLWWYGLVLLVFLIARRLIPTPPWAYLAALVAGLLPGSAYNSTIGMENGLFGLLVMLVIYLMVRWRWLSPDVPVRPHRELLLGALLGLAALLRPEGLVFASISLAYRSAALRSSIFSFNAVVARLVLPSIPFLLLTAGLVLFHMSETGDILPSSGLSRVSLSSRDSYFLGPLWFNAKFTERLVYYLPLTGVWLIGNWLILSRRWSSGTSVEGLLLALFWTFFLLYSTVLGAAHLARYVIFIMPMMVLVAGIGAMWLWTWLSRVVPTDLRGVRVAAFVVGVVGLGAVFAVETHLRRDLGSRSELARVMRAPEERRAFSNDLLALVGNPSSVPVSVAYQEVQVRYWLDDRFVVRSLDGRVDKTLLGHIQGGNYDHIGYIKDREIDFIMETPNYNRDESAWSLARLNELKDGEELSRDGLVFRRLPGGHFAVSPHAR
jgi:hypothetical protein